MLFNTHYSVFNLSAIGRPVEDEVFGHLQSKWWCYESRDLVFVASEPTVNVTIVPGIISGILGALDPARVAFMRLCSRYKELKPAIANTLRDFYESEDIWFRICLDSIVIDTRRHRLAPRIELVYRPDWDLSHRLVVRMEDFIPVSAYRA